MNVEELSIAVTQLAGVHTIANGSVDYNYNFYIFRGKGLSVTSYAGTDGSSTHS